MLNPFKKVYALGRSLTETAVPRLLQKAGVSKDVSEAVSELGGGLIGIVGIMTGAIFGMAALATAPALLAASAATLLGCAVATGGFGALSAAMIVGSAGMARNVFAEFKKSFFDPQAFKNTPSPADSEVSAAAVARLAPVAGAFKTGTPPTAEFNAAVAPAAAEKAPPVSSPAPVTAPAR